LQVGFICITRLSAFFTHFSHFNNQVKHLSKRYAATSMVLVRYCRINKILHHSGSTRYIWIDIVRSEVFTTMKNAVFWNVAPCWSCVNVCLETRSQIFLTWRWRRYVPPKRRFTQDLDGSNDDASRLHVAGADSNFARDADFPGSVYHSFHLFLQANAGILQISSLSFSRTSFAIH
jgi:hypothetical protein